MHSLRSHISKLGRRLPDGAESGVALVEFTLVLPLLLLVLFAILEFGKGFNYWIDETHLANEAARLAVVNKAPGSSGTLQNYILSQADTNELRSGGTASIPAKPQVCISFPNGTSKVGDPVKATVTLTYHWLPFLKLVDTPITASATMRLEAVPSNYGAGCSS